MPWVKSISDNKSRNYPATRMGQMKRTMGKEGNHFATIYWPINSKLQPLGRETAGSDTIYALSCSSEKEQSVQKKSLKVSSHFLLKSCQSAPKAAFVNILGCILLPILPWSFLLISQLHNVTVFYTFSKKCHNYRWQTVTTSQILLYVELGYRESVKRNSEIYEFFSYTPFNLKLSQIK